MNKNAERLNRINQIFDKDAAVQAGNLPDFMLTHVPFDHLYDETDERFIKEEEFLDTIWDERDKTRFYIVYGAPGSGKSNLITWLHEMYSKRVRKDPSEIVLWMPRGNNTLREAVHHLLNMPDGILPDDLKEKLESSANNIRTVTNQKIINGLISVIGDQLDPEQNGSENREKNLKDEFDLSLRYIKALKDLLDEDKFTKPYLISLPSSQAIENIKKKMTGEHLAGILDYKGEIFSDANFAILAKDLRNDLSPAKIKPSTSNFARKLSSDSSLRQKIAAYMNSLVTPCIKKCIMDISSQQLVEMFKEIRRVLKQKQCNLTLFVEDISIAQGMDDELIESMVINHQAKGNEELCRITSIVGMTPGFYAKLPDNIKGSDGRIKKRIKIDEANPLGMDIELDDTKLLRFAASYINAVELDRETVQNWADEGYPEARRPVAPPEYTFSSIVTENGKTMSIFPFNEQALKTMYGAIPVDMRTPRSFLTRLLQPVLEHYYEAPDQFLAQESAFTNDTVAPGKDILAASTDVNFEAWNEALRDPAKKTYEDTLEERSLLLRVWGNAKPCTVLGGPAGVSKELFDVFHVSVDPAQFSGQDVSIPPVALTVPAKPEPKTVEGQESTVVQATEEKKSEINAEYTKFCALIQEWYASTDKTKTLDDSDLRERIKYFIISNVNWQNYDIPYPMLDIGVLRDAIGMVHISSKEAAPDSLFPNEDPNAVRLILTAFAGWLYLGNESWEYENSGRDFIVAMSWIEEILPTIIQRLHDSIPVEHIDLSYVASLYVVQSIKNHIDLSEPVFSILPKLFALSNAHFAVEKHPAKWNALYENVYEKMSLYKRGGELEKIAEKVLREAKEIFSLYVGQSTIKPKYKAPSQDYLIDAYRLIDPIKQLKKMRGKIDDLPLSFSQTKGAKNRDYGLEFLKSENGSIQDAIKDYKNAYQEIQAEIDNFLSQNITEEEIKALYDATYALIAESKDRGYMDNQVAEFFETNEPGDVYQKLQTFQQAGVQDEPMDILHVISSTDFSFAHQFEDVLEHLDRYIQSIEREKDIQETDGSDTVLDTHIQKSLETIKEKSEGLQLGGE